MSTLSYSALAEYHRCGYRFYAERVLGLPATEERARRPSGPGLLDAAERGVLVHALLERLDFRRPQPPTPVAIMRAGAEAGPAPSLAEAEEIAALLAGFAGSELCARLRRAGQVRREERFAFALERGVLITGALDVLARERDGRLLIVDYKSDRLGGAEPGEVVDRVYGAQRLIYALAALRSGATEAEVIHLFLERPQAPVGARFSGADAIRLERELSELAGGVLRREFPVAQEPHRALCHGCPAEGGLCSWPPAMTRRESADRLF
jgi:ATP-dependent exoDNAse (exonuclease V) beta subunit